MTEGIGGQREPHRGQRLAQVGKGQPQPEDRELAALEGLDQMPRLLGIEAEKLGRDLRMALGDHRGDRLHDLGIVGTPRQ